MVSRPGGFHNFGRRGQCRELSQLYGGVCVSSRRYNTRERRARVRHVPLALTIFWPGEVLFPDVVMCVSNGFYLTSLHRSLRRRNKLSIVLRAARHPNPLIVVDVPIHYERDTQVVGLTRVELALRSLAMFVRPFYPRIEASIFSSFLNMRPAVWSSPGRSH